MNEASSEVSASLFHVKFSPEAVAKFHSRVDTNGPLPDQSNPHYKGLGRCHVWTRGKYPNGYGQVYLDKRHCGAHRAAMIIHLGGYRKDLQVHHKCDRKECVNPDHLWLGTQKENMADKLAKGREARGDASGSRLHPERLKRGDENGSRRYPERLKRGVDNFMAKLSDDQVREIRADYIPWENPYARLAEKYGVTQSSIMSVVKRRTWRHVV